MMPIILVRLTRVSYGNTETCLLAAQKSAKSWRATFRPECIKAGETGGRWGWATRCRSQSAAHPRIPISHPLCRPPSLLPVRANRRRCGAAVAHLSCVIVSPSLSPALPTPFALPSQIHNVFRCALLSFPRKIMYLPNYTLLATLGRATRRRRGINERIIGYRG